MQRKVILFEANEVPWRIIREYAKWRPDSFLAKNLEQCRRYQTTAEETPTFLSPWVTWPSLARGVTRDRHGIDNFGQYLGDIDKDYPPVWRLLAENNISTGVFGSLHSYPVPEALDGYSFYVPDTFAAGSECFPKHVEAFQEFNLTMARKSSRNVSSKVPWKSALGILRNFTDLGFRPGTCMSVAGHLVTERVNRARRVRRRSYQTVLGFDVFYKLLNKERPAFATFFTNHVASSMHRYWAARFPDDYEDYGFTPEWAECYRDEICFTMDKMDQMLAKLGAWVAANSDYTLWLTSSMGQAATTAEPIYTQTYLDDVPRFMNALGFSDAQFEVVPAMLPRVSLLVDASIREALRERLDRFSVDGEPVPYSEKDACFFNIKLYKPNADPEKMQVRVGERTFSCAELGLETVPIDDQANTNAYHIPEGVLLVFDPRDRDTKPAETPTEISTLDLAPSILANFGIEPPAYMNRGIAL